MPARIALIVLLLLCTPLAAQTPDPLPNPICPVMRGEASRPDRFVDYQGKRVYFCCDLCIPRFNANPAAFIQHLPQFASAPTSADPPAGAPGAATSTAPAPSQASAASPYADLFGRLHPLTIHFPIALILVALLLEILSMLPFAGGLRPAARACLVLGAIGAIAAAAMGWVRADTATFAGPAASTLQVHRWLGLFTAGFAIVAALLLLRGQRAQSAYRVMLLATAVLTGVGAHFGGAIVRGHDYLFAAFRTAQPAAPSLPAAAIASPTPAATPPPDALAQALFAPDEESAFIARRNYRLTTLPAPAAPAPPDRAIDAFLEAGWTAASLPAPELCDDTTFLRRVYLDLLGVIPTIEQADRFLTSTDPAKRTALIDELLARDDDYAAHWTPFWEDALASANTDLQGGVPTRGNYRAWIFSSFKRNRPFDLMLAELVDPAMPGHKAAANANANGKVSKVAYIKSETHTDTLQSAANLAQVFLGTSMKCASCHSHFENPEWPQKRFLAFASMFADHNLEVIRCEQNMGETVAAAFPFQIAGIPADVPAEAPARLRRLAQLVTDPANPRFARAIVNRLWKRYFGLGLFEPADDFRLDHPPSHPALLDWLAHDFMIGGAAGGYDLKHTIRRILNSRAYQARYDAAAEDHFDIAKPLEARHYRSPALRRLTAEQLIDSVRTAAEGRAIPHMDRLFRDNTSTALSRALGRPASRNEISTARPDDVAVVQALELLNGEDFHAIIAAGTFTAAPDPAATVTRLYRSILTREPTPAELELAVEYLRSGVERTGPAPAPSDEIIFNDELPAGAAIKVAGSREWPWVEGPPRHHALTSDKQVQHYFEGAREPWPINPTDLILATVRLDAANLPEQIMLQCNVEGSWEHRAYWGADKIKYGTADSPSRRRLGDLPAPGQWVMLEIPARAIGLTRASKINGFSFDQVGGHVAWDTIAIRRIPVSPAAEPLADLAWALFTSPEFQYIR